MTDFTKLFCDTILKKLVAKIASDQKKKTKAENTAMETSETDSVRTMRHWRAVSNIEFYYSEIEIGFQRIRELDQLTGWSDSLHQDRFKFMQEKYNEVLEEYLKGVK